MKNIVSCLLIALLAASCSVANVPQDRKSFSSFLDFRPYLSAGFLISPDSCPDSYSPIGILEIEVYPADIERRVTEKQSAANDAIYKSREPARSYYVKELIGTDELLEMIVDKALSLGADGLCDFRCKSVYDTHVTKESSYTTLSHYEVYGVCIKNVTK